MKDYRTEYEIREWNGLEDLSKLLNRMTADDWRVDSHKLSGGEDKSGWTIFTRTVHLKQPLLERWVNVGRVYEALNRTFQEPTDKVREFSKAIQILVRQEGDDV